MIDRLSICALLTVLVANSCSRVPDAGADQLQPTKPVLVATQVASVTTLQPELHLIGRTEAIAERTAMLTTRVAGTVRAIHAVEGQELDADAVVIELDSRTFDAQQKRATAEVARLQAELAVLESGARPAELEQARALLAQAAAGEKSLRQRLTALQQLAARDETSQIRVAQAQAALATAQSAARASAAQLALLEAGPRKESILAATAARDRAVADLTTAQLQREFCTVAAPIQGRVANLTARVGMRVGPASTLATVLDLRQVFVRVRIPTDALDQVALGTTAEIRHASSRGLETRIEGKIVRMAPQANVGTGGVDALVQIDNLDGALIPGLVCRVTLHMTPVVGAVVVPARAIADRDGIAVVTVVRDGKAYEVEVGLGAHEPSQVQVTGGVKAGDVVVTEGGYGLPDGCPVQSAR